MNLSKPLIQGQFKDNNKHLFSFNVSHVIFYLTCKRKEKENRKTKQIEVSIIELNHFVDTCSCMQLDQQPSLSINNQMGELARAKEACLSLFL